VVEDKIDKGYDLLLCLDIRNRDLVLKDDDDLWKETGFLYEAESNAKYIVKEVEAVHSRMVFALTTCSAIVNGMVICDSCAAVERDLRKMTIKRAEFRSPEDGIGRCTNHRYILSTPATAFPYLQSEAERRKRHIEMIWCYKAYNQRIWEKGVEISTESACNLFDDDSLNASLEDIEGRGTISQSEMISFLWRESVTNFKRAKKSGKKRMRFDPVFLKFAIYLHYKVNTGTYKFIAEVFNLPSNRTLSNYDILDGQSKDGLLHDTIQQMEIEFEERKQRINCLNPMHGEWLGSGVLKFDEMKVKEKL